MSEMVQRVAKAIEVEISKLASYDNIPGFYDDIARACIQVMHEPTSEIGLAIYSAWDKLCEQQDYEPVMGPEEAIAIWQAAIDEALR